MIKFSLVCKDGHEFEAWFRNGAAYEAQAAREQVVCPHCGSNAVEKAIMAPAVAKRVEGDHAQAGQQRPSLPAREQDQFLRKVRDEIRGKAQYVGGRFAEEARKIHFDEGGQRNIYGEASADEVKALAEDDVPFFPMPRLPEDLN
jgi:hypothetical protein